MADLSLKERIKAALDPDGLLYNALALAFAGITLSSSRWRNALRRIRRDGMITDDAHMSMASLLPVHLLDLMLSHLQPKSVLDVGCGTGQAMTYLISRGVEVVGVEGSAAAIRKAVHRERIVQADLRLPLELNRRFDVVWSYEVAEHIHPSFTDTFVGTLGRHADRIILSAAKPGQGGEGHFNEQESGYWVSKLEAIGFDVDERLTTDLRSTPDEFAINMIAFVRRSASSDRDC